MLICFWAFCSLPLISASVLSPMSLWLDYYRFLQNLEVKYYRSSDLVRPQCILCWLGWLFGFPVPTWQSTGWSIKQLAGILTHTIEFLEQVGIIDISKVLFSYSWTQSISSNTWIISFSYQFNHVPSVDPIYILLF